MEARENLRGSGILLSISSLPSPYGIGTLGREAYNFVDLLGDLKQKYWQVLPVGPTIFGDSPYQPSSGCAGNIYFIDLDKLADEGLLEREEILGYNWGTDQSEIDYAALHQNRYKILQKAFERFDTNAQEFQDFVKKHSGWLEQYALFMTLKTDNLDKIWSEWPSEYKNPQAVALEKYQKKNYNTITFWKFCQYKFFQQWEAFENSMRDAGLEIYPELMGHGYYIPETAQYYVSNFIAAGATAILCGSDAIAKGVISECQLHGFNVPNDISVVGFDDVKFAAALTPPLTTIRQECNDLGRCAYIILNSLIHHIPISRTQLRPRLIERESTARVSTAHTVSE